MSSLSEHERLGLDDVFLSLEQKHAISDRLKEQKNRFFAGFAQVVFKGIPFSLKYMKLKSRAEFRRKTMFQERSKMDNFKLFNHFRPKNRDSK